MKNLLNTDGLSEIQSENIGLSIGEKKISYKIGEKKVLNRFHSWNPETLKHDIPCYNTVYFLENKQEIKNFLKENDNYWYYEYEDDYDKTYSKKNGVLQTQYHEYDIGRFDIVIEDEHGFYDYLIDDIEGDF